MQYSPSSFGFVSLGFISCRNSEIKRPGGVLFVHNTRESKAGRVDGRRSRKKRSYEELISLGSGLEQN